MSGPLIVVLVKVCDILLMIAIQGSTVLMPASMEVRHVVRNLPKLWATCTANKSAWCGCSLRLPDGAFSLSVDRSHSPVTDWPPDRPRANGSRLFLRSMAPYRRLASAGSTCLRAVTLQTRKSGGCTVTAHPATVSPLAGGIDHSGDNQSGCNAPVMALDVQVVEDIGETEIVERLEARSLAADRRQVLMRQAVEADGGEIGTARLFAQRLGVEPQA